MTNFMSGEQIYKTIKELGRSQGFYSRLGANLDSMEEDQREQVLVELENEGFKDAVDLVMFLECGC